LFRPTWDGAASYSIVATNLITAPQFDLVDFELTDQKLWGLWCNSEGDMHISAYSLEPVSMDCWLSLKEFREKEELSRLKWMQSMFIAATFFDQENFNRQRSLKH
jgi:hypothetical protein